MLINGILNVAIGLALTFGVISLVASALTEAVASVLSLRSKTLLTGIKQLLNDPNATGLALAVYQHAAVNPLGGGQAPTVPAAWAATGGSYKAVSGLLGKMPSYVEAKGFASALIDAIQNRQQPGGMITDITQAVAAIQDPQLRAVIGGFLDRANNDVAGLHDRLATWFDAAMDRLSGDYKRRAQWINLAIAGALVIALDVDAVALARQVYADPGVLQHMDVDKTNPSLALMAWSKTFPFGWHAFWDGWAENGPVLAILSTLLGWTATTVATLFGAPFWFDTLQRFVQIRGTGPEAGVDPTKPRAKT
jgi:hypothetical protein